LPEIIRLPIECYKDQKQTFEDGEKEKENTEEETKEEKKPVRI